MNKSSRKTILLVMAVFGWITGSSQGRFRYSSKIDSVPLDGFYRIRVHPDISGLAMPGLSDVRVVDDRGVQVPYVVHSEGPAFSYRNFVEFPLLSVKKQANNQLEITLQSQADTGINHLLLFTRNAEASRYVNLSGSDDGKKWFILKEQIGLHNFAGDRDTSVQMLSFPVSGYRYLRVNFLGKNLLPVNVIKAGIYKYGITEGSYIAIPPPVVQQTDSLGNTFLRVRFKQVYLIEKLQLVVTGPVYYKREVSYSTKGFVKGGEYIASSSSNTLHMSLRATEVLLTIHNGDSPPLKIKEVKAWQLNRSLLAYLKQGTHYQLCFDDSSLLPPEYDLAFFKDSIRQTTAIGTGAIEPNNIASKVPVIKTKIPVGFVWAVIVVVAGLLLFLTIRMIREIGERKV